MTDQTEWKADEALKRIDKHEQACSEKYKGIYSRLGEIEKSLAALLVNTGVNRWLLTSILGVLLVLSGRIIFFGIS